MRPRLHAGADATPRPGRLHGGNRGAARKGADGAVRWVSTLLRGRPRTRKDLIRMPRSSEPQELWLVIVDASASTRRHHSLSRAKGLLSQLFDDAYRRRVRLALLTASGHSPSWKHQGLKACASLNPWLDQLGAGGGTPLFATLQLAIHWLAIREQQRPNEQQRVLMLTDGRVKDMPIMAKLQCPSVLIDIESGPIRLGRAMQLASVLGADYCHIDALSINSELAL
ncbi:VWA domain-containing protein [Pseudomonas sp. 10B1]|uniref:vWA domain-containing protein n=1 Tax=unclassified Pseudomonas TaxID=196821 RepID=UPI002B3BA8AF|nr:VWA domain-containing protein [Pseudomonas sp. RTS4]MEA9993929.1 VWA domain-containing protein [Pseudomonas sp. AA4]MEB0085391.1 VWA domain-containing protein [Pseudomonas sp. RTI1]MEB0124453.1 VWA domain-containing protein [Pseudomonas sp. CCC1.2]MEB0151781.1 VWA domain-containing protein [Pseudomonas sp. CCC4.3]MEB0198833.1 VWA domain-containing protein [Pseudomonas sp. 5S4]MEB0220762.1 VWA domain-containing protein [Pseudomonas sp. AB12(2023)]MEB0245139.1 VWA domain-containing protein 